MRFGEDPDVDTKAILAFARQQAITTVRFGAQPIFSENGNETSLIPCAPIAKAPQGCDSTGSLEWDGSKV